MKTHTYQYLHSDAVESLKKHKLMSALQSLQGLATSLGQWTVKDEVDNLVGSYQILLNYMKRGAADPERARMYQGFVRRAYELADVLEREGALSDKESYYATSFCTLQNLKGQCFSLAELASDEGKTHARNLFEGVMLSGAWTADDETAMNDYMASEAHPQIYKCLLLSAVTLSAMKFFDVAKYRFLLDYSMAGSTELRVRALTGMVFVHICHADRVAFYPEIESRLRLMADIPNFVREIENLQMQLFLSLETKRIERNLQKEIIPEMMKRMQQIKLDNSSDMDELQEKLSALELNPEWDKDEDKAKLSEYMHDFIELQQRGADMYMGSFKAINQRFSFFHTACNWFWPFTLNHPDLPKGLGENPIVRLFFHNEGLCDTDKYSFCLMAEEMSRTDGLAANLLSKLEEMKEGSLEFLSESDFKGNLRSYVQGFYRFCNLYMHRSQFVNPFQLNLFIADYTPFDRLLKDDDFLLRMANFVFKDKSYNLASMLFKRLPDVLHTANIWQKEGYSHECCNEIQQACACYERADALKPHSAWTLRRLASCWRTQGIYEKALRCYDELECLDHEDVDIALRQAECLVNLKRFDEALKYLYKVNYLQPDSEDALRALAWCSLLTKKFDQAERYYAKVSELHPTATDYLNAGHVAWLQGKLKEAISFYKQSQADAPDVNFLEKDADLLRASGLNDDDLAMMTDAVSC